MTSSSAIPAPPAPGDVPRPASPGTTPAALQAAPSVGAPPPLSAESSLTSLALPAVALLALAAAALLLGRRRRAEPKLVEIIERTSLGPKRALVLARLGEEVLLLGSSEAGIALIRSRRLARSQPEAAPPAAPPADRPAVRSLASAIAKLTPLRRPAAAAEAGFESLLVESAEDQELRRKLAAGMSGSVR